MEGRVVQSTAMADEEKNIVGKRSKKSIPLSHTHGEIRRTVTKTAKTRNHTTHMGSKTIIHPPTHHRSRYTHHTHVTMTVMILTTQQSPTKLSSKSPTHPQNVFTVIFSTIFCF